MKNVLITMLSCCVLGVFYPLEAGDVKSEIAANVIKRARENSRLKRLDAYEPAVETLLDQMRQVEFSRLPDDTRVFFEKKIAEAIVLAAKKDVPPEQLSTAARKRNAVLASITNDILKKAPSLAKENKTLLTAGFCRFLERHPVVALIPEVAKDLSALEKQGAKTTDEVKKSALAKYVNEFASKELSNLPIASDASFPFGLPLLRKANATLRKPSYITSFLKKNLLEPETGVVVIDRNILKSTTIRLAFNTIAKAPMPNMRAITKQRAIAMIRNFRENSPDIKPVIMGAVPNELLSVENEALSKTAFLEGDKEQPKTKNGIGTSFGDGYIGSPKEEFIQRADSWTISVLHDVNPDRNNFMAAKILSEFEGAWAKKIAELKEFYGDKTEDDIALSPLESELLAFYRKETHRNPAWLDVKTQQQIWVKKNHHIREEYEKNPSPEQKRLAAEVQKWLDAEYMKIPEAERTAAWLYKRIQALARFQTFLFKLYDRHNIKKRRIANSYESDCTRTIYEKGLLLPDGPKRYKTELKKKFQPFYEFYLVAKKCGDPLFKDIENSTSPYLSNRDEVYVKYIQHEMPEEERKAGEKFREFLKAYIQEKAASQSAPK